MRKLKPKKSPVKLDQTLEVVLHERLVSRESSPLQLLRLVTLTGLSHLNEAVVSVLLSFKIISFTAKGTVR